MVGIPKWAGKEGTGRGGDWVVALSIYKKTEAQPLVVAVYPSLKM